MADKFPAFLKDCEQFNNFIFLVDYGKRIIVELE